MPYRPHVTYINRYFVFIVCLFLSFSVLSNTEKPDWILEKVDKENDIEIHYRVLSSGNIEFRGVTKVQSSLNGLVALLSDVKSMKHWVYRVIDAELIDRPSDTEIFSHVYNSAPFPFQNRDSVVQSFIIQEPETLNVTITGNSRPDLVPESEDYVRVKLVDSYWRFEPLGKGQVRVIFQGLGEPGGNIPGSIYKSKVFFWIASEYLWDLPLQTLVGLRREIKKVLYQNKRFSYIQEAN